MSKVTLAQFSFNRGEIAPALHGRSDWKYYSSGAEKLVNLIARPQGGAVKRGGLRLVARALDPAWPSRLVAFRFSVSQSYLLEFSHFRLRVIRDGGVVVYPDGHERAGEEVVVDTPYPAADLDGLCCAQTADVMIVAHPGYPPRRLSRHDHHDWRLERLFSGAPTPTPEGLTVTESGGDSARYLVTAVAAEGESAPSEIVVAVNADAVAAPGEALPFSQLYAWLRLHDYTYMPTELRFHDGPWSRLLEWLTERGYANQGGVYEDGGMRWRYIRPGETAERSLWYRDDNLDALVDECLFAADSGWAGMLKPSLWAAVERYAADYNSALPGSGATSLSWQPVEGATSYRVYRDRGADGQGRFFLIGETEAAAFTDSDLPALSGGLPAAATLFTGVDDYPGVCAFFEQRLVFARSNAKPTTFWGSETGSYAAFGKHTPVEDADAYEFTLAGGEMNEIHWIVPLNEMLLGTSGGEWKAGGGGTALTPTAVNARLQSWYGCSPLQPVVVGRTVIFAGRARQTLRSLSYSLEADGYAGQDLTAYASHLFAGKRIAALCYQREPDGILWVVMSDGTLLSCTYAPDEDVAAWSRHETAGRFESCASLADPDGGDQVYFCVERTLGGQTVRCIETLDPAADAVKDPADGIFLDCALSYRGSPTEIVSGLEHLEGERIAVLADGSVFDNVVVSGGRAELPNGFAASVIHAGLPYTAELETLELEPEATETIRNRARFAVSAAVRLLSTRECLYSHSDGVLAEMKFRTSEAPGQPARLFTGEKNIVFSSPPGARTTKLRFVSPSPVPFTVLGIVAEACCGQPA